jgi:hypothetical protein
MRYSYSSWILHVMKFNAALDDPYAVDLSTIMSPILANVEDSTTKRGALVDARSRGSAAWNNTSEPIVLVRW